jgi:membrane fusion protein (multidrug efflux system)
MADGMVLEGSFRDHVIYHRRETTISARRDMEVVMKRVRSFRIALGSFRATMGIFTVVFLSVTALSTGGCKKKEQAAAPPIQVVTAIKVTAKDTPVTSTFVAQVESSHQVEIMARVSGFLEKMLYKEGDVVRPGQLLFQMDQKPFIAQVNAFTGEVENRQAQLWTAKATLDRIKPLAALNAASKSDLDNATGAVKSAEAQLFEAKSRLERAKLDLSYTSVRSPINGVTGQALVREGAYIAAVGPSAKLTYVARIDPIWVNFSVSQNELASMNMEVNEGRLVRPKNLNYEVEVELSDGTRFPHKGKISFLAPTFSQETGTFLVRAELPNPEKLLRPGMFVKAYVSGAVRPNAIVVPQKAVQETANGHVVYLVNDSGKAELRPVVVGDWIGDGWIVNQGLKAGDRLIIEGFQRLGPGAPVKAVTPEEAAAAKAAAASAKPEQTAKPAPPAAK